MTLSSADKIRPKVGRAAGLPLFLCLILAPIGTGRQSVLLWRGLPDSNAARWAEFPKIIA